MSRPGVCMNCEMSHHSYLCCSLATRMVGCIINYLVKGYTCFFYYSQGVEGKKMVYRENVTFIKLILTEAEFVSVQHSQNHRKPVPWKDIC